jgi:hypothetical protein
MTAGYVRLEVWLRIRRNLTSPRESRDEVLG